MTEKIQLPCKMLTRLGLALQNREALKSKRTYLIRERNLAKKIARRAKWFSEDRYNKFSVYWEIKAELAALKVEAKENEKLIAKLEKQIAKTYYNTPEGAEMQEALNNPAQPEPEATEEGGNDGGTCAK